MRKLVVFNSVSLDGFFTDGDGDMSWAHVPSEDAEWDKFVAANASGDGTLVFGRKTYEMMASFWPTPMAAERMPEVAAGMNRSQKIVFSKTLSKADWQNTTLPKGDLCDEVRKLKAASGPGMCVLGSGSVVSQLAAAGLVDEFQIVVIPVILGRGRTLFETVRENVSLKRLESKSFANGNVFLRYVPAR